MKQIGQTSETDLRIVKFHNLLVLSMTAMAVLAMLVLFALYHRENNHTIIRYVNEFTVGDVSEIQYEIEEEGISSSGDYRISGWFIRTGATYDVFNAGLMQWFSNVYNNNHLCYVKDDVVYELPTHLEYRKDVNSKIDDGVDYWCSGFYARVPEKDMDIIEGAVMGMIAETPDHEEILYQFE